VVRATYGPEKVGWYLRISTICASFLRNFNQKVIALREQFPVLQQLPNQVLPLLTRNVPLTVSLDHKPTDVQRRNEQMGLECVRTDQFD